MRKGRQLPPLSPNQHGGGRGGEQLDGSGWGGGGVGSSGVVGPQVLDDDCPHKLNKCTETHTLTHTQTHPHSATQTHRHVSNFS